MNTHLRVAAFLLNITVLVAGVATHRNALGEDISPDFLMDSDPQLEIPAPVANVNPAYKKLWIAALQRPEADMQRMAAETIARAHEAGMPDLIAAVPSLEKILQAESAHPASRFAAARALIVLDSRGSAAKLFEASKVAGAEVRQLVEPALARWDFGAARTVWIERLNAPQTRRRDLILAIRGLAVVREEAALASVMTLVNDRAAEIDLRMEASAAAGQISDSGLDQAAEKLARDTKTPYFVNQLCALRLLSRHQGENVVELLTGLAGHAEPAVAAAALNRLNEIDSGLVLPLAESAVKNRDPLVRRAAIQAWLALPTADRASRLCELLVDPHPGIRKDVSVGLKKLAASAELQATIGEATLRVIDAERVHVEPVELLGALEYKPAAQRLVELLETPRDDVMVSAAWSLRKLAVQETVPALIDKANRQTERRRHETVPALDDQVAHLFEALGVLQAKDSMPLLMQYVSKDFYQGDRSRGAAIWAIGRLMEGTRNSELEDQLSERITDFADRQPETPRVKQMSAIALARMKADDQALLLKGVMFRSARPVELAVALRWAVKQLTNEDLPPAEPENIATGNWFLEPIP